MDDYWNVDGERETIRCMDRLHKIHFIERKLTDVHGPEGDFRKQTTSRPDNLWPDMWKQMSDAAKKQSEAKVGHRETQTR